MKSNPSDMAMLEVGPNSRIAPETRPASEKRFAVLPLNPFSAKVVLSKAPSLTTWCP